MEKPLAIALIAGVLLSGAALAQQSGRLRPGDADPYASRPGASNPYAPRAGDANPYATKAGDPSPSSVRDYRDQRDQRDEHRRRPAEEQGATFAKDPHTTHLPYGTSSGSSTRRR